MNISGHTRAASWPQGWLSRATATRNERQGQTGWWRRHWNDIRAAVTHTAAASSQSRLTVGGSVARSTSQWLPAVSRADQRVNGQRTDVISLTSRLRTTDVQELSGYYTREIRAINAAFIGYTPRLCP